MGQEYTHNNNLLELTFFKSQEASIHEDMVLSVNFWLFIPQNCSTVNEILEIPWFGMHEMSSAVY